MKSHQPFASVPYKNFKVAVYATVHQVQKMKDLRWLENTYTLLSQYVHIDKVYLEIHRDEIMADEEAILEAKRFFQDSGSTRIQ